MSQLAANMPPEQLAALEQQMQAAGGMGGPPGAGGQQRNVVRLTEAEMASVNRLTDMGFDRQEAAQVFLACDKNEALAANMLMDDMAGGGGFAPAPAPAPDGGAGGGTDGAAGGGGDDSMYD